MTRQALKKKGSGLRHATTAERNFSLLEIQKIENLSDLGDDGRLEGCGCQQATSEEELRCQYALRLRSVLQLQTL